MRHIAQLQNLIQKDNSHVIIVIYDRLDKIEAKELQEKLEKLGVR
jgi:adenine-specific DNA methylase